MQIYWLVQSFLYNFLRFIFWRWTFLRYFFPKKNDPGLFGFKTIGFILSSRIKNFLFKNHFPLLKSFPTFARFATFPTKSFEGCLFARYGQG